MGSLFGVSLPMKPVTMFSIVEQTGLTFPILLDTNGAVNAAYQQLMAFPTAAYPQDWIVGNDGTIIYKNNAFELDAMEQAIQSQL